MVGGVKSGFIYSLVMHHIPHAMDISSVDKLVLAIMFVIPGFLMLKAGSVLSLEPVADTSKQLIDAVAYSCINYAILAWPIFMIEGSSLKATSRPAYYAFYVFVLLVAPILLALLWQFCRRTQLLQRLLPHPTAKPWDYVFRQRRRFWVLVTFKDGKQVGGRYDSKSFSSASPSAEQLYLEEAWQVNDDGGLERIRVNSGGILILGSEVRTVEFFNIMEVENGNTSNVTGSSAEGLAADSSKGAIAP